MQVVEVGADITYNHLEQEVLVAVEMGQPAQLLAILVTLIPVVAVVETVQTVQVRRETTVALA